MTGKAHDANYSAASVVSYGLPVVVAALVFLCFLPVLRNQFINWDDPRYFAENQFYRGLSWSHLSWMFTTMYMGHYQPLSWLTHGLIYTLGGMNPTGYHLASLLLHATNAVLFYLLILAIWAPHGVAPDDAIAARVSAAAGALFFAIHPLRVEPVAWATDLQDVLCTVFALLTVLAYLHMVVTRRPSTARRWYYLASVVFFALSLLAKAAAVMLPVVLLALDIYPLRRLLVGARRLDVAVLIEKVPYILLASAATALAFVAKEQRAMVSLARHGLVERLMQAMYGVCFYLWKTVVPIRLAPIYLLEDHLDATRPRYILSTLVVLGVTTALIVFRRRWPWALLAWVCYIVIALPVLGLVQSGAQIAADRYSYLACLPWAVLVAAGVHHLIDRCRLRRLDRAVIWVVAVGLLAVLTGLALQTRQQAGVWQNSLTFWDHVLFLDPANSLAHNSRGVAREEKGDLEGAAADYTDALRLNPQLVEAYNNRGNVRDTKGDRDGALADYDQALRLSPQYAAAYSNRGVVRQAKGDLDGALADYDRALRLDPRAVDAYVNRCSVRNLKGDQDGAVADCSVAIRLNPSHRTAYGNRGLARQAKGDFTGSIADYMQALQLGTPRGPYREKIERNLAVARQQLAMRGAHP